MILSSLAITVGCLSLDCQRHTTMLMKTPLKNMHPYSQVLTIWKQKVLIIFHCQKITVELYWLQILLFDFSLCSLQCSTVQDYFMFKYVSTKGSRPYWLWVGGFRVELSTLSHGNVFHKYQVTKNCIYCMIIQ